MSLVYVPNFGSVRSETRAVLDGSGLRWVDLRLKADTDYFDVLRFLWSRRETFWLVEHDMVPTVFDSIGVCGNAWCSGVGVARFSAEIMDRKPLIFEGSVFDPPRHRVGEWLSVALNLYGHADHWSGLRTRYRCCEHN